MRRCVRFAIAGSWNPSVSCSSCGIFLSVKGWHHVRYNVFVIFAVKLSVGCF